jgi:hypothetical protein
MGGKYSPNRHGPVDFTINLLKTAKTVGVKDRDFFKGIAQNDPAALECHTA